MRALTTCRAGISTAAPVAGLRPTRRSRFCTTSFAMPGSIPSARSGVPASRAAGRSLALWTWAPSITSATWSASPTPCPPSGSSRHTLRIRTWVTASNHRRITAPHTRTFNHGAALVLAFTLLQHELRDARPHEFSAPQQLLTARPPSYRAPDDATKSPAAVRPAGSPTRERREEDGTGQETDGEREWSRAGDRLPRQPASEQEAVGSPAGPGGTDTCETAAGADIAR